MCVCVCVCAGLHASLPSVILPASEELFGVCDLSLIRKGWEDLLGTNHREKRQLLSGAATQITLCGKYLQNSSLMHIQKST